MGPNSLTPGSTMVTHTFIDTNATYSGEEVLALLEAAKKVGRQREWRTVKSKGTIRNKRKAKNPLNLGLGRKRIFFVSYKAGTGEPRGMLCVQ